MTLIKSGAEHCQGAQSMNENKITAIHFIVNSGFMLLFSQYIIFIHPESELSCVILFFSCIFCFVA